VGGWVVGWVLSVKKSRFLGSLNLTEICAKVSILSDPCLILSTAIRVLL